MGRFDYVIVDIESYLHKACGACKVLQPVDKDGFCYAEMHDVRKGMDYIDQLLNGFKEKFWSNSFILVVGDKDNFRKKLNPSYKAHRGSKPLMYDILLDYIVTKYKVIALPNVEADDTARIIFEDDINFKGEKLIVTVDKDFFSVPCNLFRDNPKNREVVTVSEEDARINEYIQIIMGDKTDGYSGVPLYGEAKAKAFVTPDTTFKDIVQLYIDNGLTEEDAIMNYNMAHIVGYKDYDFMKNDVIQLKKVEVK